MEEKKESQEVALMPPINGEVIQVSDYEDLISLAQRRGDIVTKLINYSLKVTTPRDWVSQEGSPYLVHSGAEKVARLFGIKLSNIKTEKMAAEDTKGKYYIYKTTGQASLPGKFDSIEALGTCSQRDKFFAFARGEWKDTIEVDETNIMKSSYSNFVVNSITHLLGLRNITWDMLKAAGLNIEQIQKVEYKGGSKKVEATDKEKETQKKLWDLLLKLAAGNETMAKEMLVTHSEFTSKEGEKVEGKDDVRYLTGKWLNYVYAQVKKTVEKLEERMPGDD